MTSPCSEKAFQFFELIKIKLNTDLIKSMFDLIYI